MIFGMRMDIFKKKAGGGIQPLRRKKKLPVPNIPKDERENRSTWGKIPLAGHRENPN